MSVRAFQPRKVDPPHFVAETVDELAEMEGQYLSAEQCDGCGNHTYRVEVRMIAPGTRQFEARCAVDPDASTEFQNSDPCSTVYPITIWDDDLVVF